MKTTAWRIVQDSLKNNSFDGEGARLKGGRWNHKGIAIIYTAGSLSLAVLETLVHVEDPAVLDQYVCIPVEFDESLMQRVDDASLPPGWNSNHISLSAMDVGTKWAQDRSSLVLAVPSAIILPETNYLLNPLHPEFGKIKIGKPLPFPFDPRLIKAHS
ncbi:MAG: RES family NAD+ phosphorylase [Candidatus Sumerlaeota bacterium]|nr:RES family NAD+ phosphorylase [Candidatus Sumerlaeota bacterium]